jgi:hypothetical protein
LGGRGGPLSSNPFRDLPNKKKEEEDPEREERSEGEDRIFEKRRGWDRWRGDVERCGSVAA